MNKTIILIIGIWIIVIGLIFYFLSYNYNSYIYEQNVSQHSQCLKFCEEKMKEHWCYEAMPSTRITRITNISDYLIDFVCECYIRGCFK